MIVATTTTTTTIAVAVMTMMPVCVPDAGVCADADADADADVCMDRVGRRSWCVCFFLLRGGCGLRGDSAEASQRVSERAHEGGVRNDGAATANGLNVEK
jgi:hypothetical protein